MKIGDKVKVIKCNQYRQKYIGETGEIIRVYNQHFGVLLDRQTNKASQYGCYWFKCEQIELLSEIFIESEDDIIMLNVNEFRIAKVKFMDGGYDRTCNQTYALYDEDIAQGDVVVVKTGHHGLAVVTVEEILEHGTTPKCEREIICKVDLDAYNARKERQAKLLALQAEMNKRVKELQTRQFMKCFQKKDTTMQALLKEFKQLTEKKAGEKDA